MGETDSADKFIFGRVLHSSVLIETMRRYKLVNHKLLSKKMVKNVSQLKKIDLPENLSGRAVFVTTVKERC
jgi:hypothetical protein